MQIQTECLHLPLAHEQCAQKGKLVTTYHLISYYHLK